VSTSFIVAGAIWPSAEVTRALAARIAAAVPDSEVIEARESPDAPRGAAAVIADAVARATGETIVVLEPWADLPAGVLSALAQTARSGLAIEAGPDVARLAWPAAPPGPDLVAALAATVAAGEAALDPRPAPAWGLSRAILDAAGGLDPAFWSVGILDDLRARVDAGEIEVPSAAAPGGRRSAWPMSEALRRFFLRRNRLLTAARALPPDRLGDELARVAVEALRAATVASGLTGEQFRFGGTWGSSEGALARILRPGADGASYIADHAGTLAPLLALDSALDELPRVTAARPAALSAAGVEAAESTAPAAALPTSASPPDAAPAAGELPRVSIVIVSWNGLEHLGPCLRSLEAGDYPAARLEIVVVDNGSTDGSVAWLAREHPGVRVVALPANLGFTGGNAAGVAAATGDVLVFLNNDMRVEPDTVRRLVAATAGGACAAARVLSWDGRAIDFLRGTISFEARGFQDFYGEPAALDRRGAGETFFPNGGAFAVTRDAYARAGGFDEAFFAYYDDVDLGWRLRLAGVELRVEDAAIVYHRHGATSRTQPAGQKRFLMERNALWTILKNYGEPTLRRTLGAALLLAVRRMLDDARLDARAPGLACLAPFSRRLGGAPAAFAGLYETRGGSPAGDAQARAALAFPVESLAAIGAVVGSLAVTAEVRRAIQSRRQASERDILPRFGRTFERLSAFSTYHAIQDALVTSLDLGRIFRPRARLLILSHEAIATRMSGPAVRFLEIGRALSRVARVTLAMPGRPELRDARVTIAGFDPARPDTLLRLAEDADVVFVQGFALAQYSFLTRLMVPIVVDLYCPFTIEHLEQTRARAIAGDTAVIGEAAGVLAVQNAQLAHGDFFICASEVQRDFWIGALHAMGRVNPRTYAADPTLRTLVDVVPFGLPDDDFDATAAALPPVLKGVRPGIGAADTVLLWGGSLLDWQDPVTLIEAVAQLAPERPDLRLVFMGTKHPNPLVAPMRVVEESRERARALGLLDRHVFFNDWVPYTERARYLAEADLGVSTHREHLETHFAYRTRMLDYIWARLPIVCTDGDVFAALVRTRGLGAVVPPGDPAALARAIDRLLGDPAARSAARERLSRVGRDMQWSRVVSPLERFLREPRAAADRAEGLARVHAGLAGSYRVSKWLKRTALRIGMTERRVEQLKRTRAVEVLMAWRNRRALARARQRAD